MAMNVKKNMTEAAETALSGYKRKGLAADPKHPEHIRAYLTMRQFSQRITGQAFMEYLRNQVKDIATGAKVK